MAIEEVLTLDGSDLTHFQACPRRWLLDHHWRVLRWRAKALFDSCLREGIFNLSNGAAVEEVIQSSRTRFLSVAANPGLDLTEGADSWVVANDFCAMLSTVLTAISRLTLLTVERIPAVDGILGESVSWQPLSWRDESGVLHRWITVDDYDDGVLAREAHGWYVFGDMVACDAPLTLHVIEIGQQRNGRRASPWCRAYKHPMIAGRFRFTRKYRSGNAQGAYDGKPMSLGGNWEPLYYADQTSPDPDAWVDLMDSDQVTHSLLHHIPIAQPSEGVRRTTLDQIAELGQQMRNILQRPPMEVPMARGACDGLVVCPWQQCCFVPDPLHVDIAGIGLYQKRSLSPHVVSLASKTIASPST